LLQAAAQDYQEIAALEDVTPLDPSLPAEVRFGSSTYRLHPGSQERPIAAVRRAVLVAGVIDDVLIEEQGFGLTDLIELFLRVSHASVVHMAPTWAGLRMRAPSAPATVSQAELTAYSSLPSIESAISLCARPVNARAALRSFTSSIQDLTFDVGDPNSAFGSVLAVEFGDGQVWSMPSSVQIDAFTSAVSVLAREAASLRPSVAEALHSVVTARVSQRLWDAQLISAVTLQDGGTIDFIAGVAARHALAIQCVPHLANNRDQLHEAAVPLERLSPGDMFRAAGRIGQVPPGTEILRLCIVASSGHMMIMGPRGIATLTLDFF